MNALCELAETLLQPVAGWVIAVIVTCAAVVAAVVILFLAYRVAFKLADLTKDWYW